MTTKSAEDSDSRAFVVFAQKHNSWLLNVQIWIQVQRFACGNVHLLIKLHTARRAHLDVVATLPKIHGFQFSHRAGKSSVDVYLRVFNASVELHSAGRWSVTVIAVWI